MPPGETEAPPAGFAGRARRVCGGIFYVDLRSLAALRIGLGLVMILDLATRARHLVAHYTDLGVAPRDVLHGEYGAMCYLSLHWWLSPSPAAVAALFVIHGLAAALLAAGWHTRMFNAICWYLVASLHTRLPLLHTAGDTTLQLLLFWSLLLPLRARWSIDARRRGDLSCAGSRYLSAASFGILFQVVCIYFFAAVLKLFNPVWRDGSAVALALNIDALPTPLAAWLRQFEGILPLLTLAALGWELVGSLLPFVPGITAVGRSVAVIGFWLLHLGFGLSFNLGIFPLISSLAWLVFIPTEVWDRLCPQTASPPQARSMRAAPVVNVLAAGACVLVLLLNLRSVGPLRRLIPAAVARAGSAVKLRQGWSMFTDLSYQGAYAGWYIVAARLADGRDVDMLNGGAALSWDRPELASRRYGTARWTQFLYYYHEPMKSPFWAPYARYLCRTWNGRHDASQQAQHVAVWYMGRVRGEFGALFITDTMLYEQDCTPPDG